MRRTRQLILGLSFMGAVLIATGVLVITHTGSPSLSTHNREQPHTILDAVRERDLLALDRFLAAGADPNLAIERIPPISLAVGVDDFRIVDRLLHAGADPNTRGPDGGTPLTFLLMIGAPVDNIRSLLAAGASVSLRGTDGHTPLEAAAAGGTPQHIQLMLDSGAQFGTAERYSALHWAITFDKTENVKFLLQHGVDPNGVGPDGLTVLEQFAGAQDRTNSLGALLDAGADPDRKIAGGLSARDAARNMQNHVFLDLLETRDKKRDP